jgi:hypothetical protein
MVTTEKRTTSKWTVDPPTANPVKLKHLIFNYVETPPPAVIQKTFV